MGVSELADVFLTLRSLHVVLIAVAIYLLVQIISVKRRSSSLPLPPGPRPLPLLGNLLDFPNEGPEWLHWAKHKETYGNLRLQSLFTTNSWFAVSGPISSIKAFGTTFFIVNDRKIAFDLLDKRSARYSDRPLFPFGGQMYVLRLVRYRQTTLSKSGLALIVGSQHWSSMMTSSNYIANSFIITSEHGQPWRNSSHWRR